MRNVFDIIFGHRHTWIPYKLITNMHRTIFYCRRCKCGERQIQRAGPMGNGDWVGIDEYLQPFERDWLDSAEPYDE